MAEAKGANLSREEMAEQASYQEQDQFQRQTRRADETKGDPDERDIAGAINHEDTPHGWEERKHDVAQEAEGDGR